MAGGMIGQDIELGHMGAASIISEKVFNLFVFMFKVYQIPE